MYRLLQRVVLFAVGLSIPMAGITVGSLGAFGISPSKIATALLFVLVAVKFVLSGDRRMPRGAGKAAVLVFTAALLLSAGNSLARGLSVEATLTALSRFIGLAVFYFMLLYVVRTRDELTFLLWSIAIGGALTSFPALIQMRQGGFALTEEERALGLAGQPNTLGYELNICLGVAAALFFAVRSPFRRMIVLGSAALIGTAIAGSLSRSAYLSLVCMWGYWIVSARRLDTLKYLIPGAAIALAAVFVMPTEIRDRFGSMLDRRQRQEDTSIQARFVQLEWVGRAFVSNPLTGVGIGNYVPWLRQQPRNPGHFNSVHNGYLRLLSETGLLGLIPFLLLISFSWLDYGRVRRMSAARRSRGDPALRELGSYALFLQVTLLGATIGTLTHDFSFSKGWWLVMALSPVVRALAAARAHELSSQIAPTVEDDMDERIGPFYGTHAPTRTR